MIRSRIWLIPAFAALSLLLSVPVWRWDTYYGWVIDYSLISWFMFYLGMLFLGLAAWESANVIGGRSETILLGLCTALAISIFLANLWLPLDSRDDFFDFDLVPSYILAMLTIIMTWNLVLMHYSNHEAPLRLNLLAAGAIIVIIWSMVYIIPLRLNAEQNGQMVSFFIMVIPNVLIWEGVLDSRVEQRGILEIMAISILSFLGIFLAALFGSLVWVS